MDVNALTTHKTDIANMLSKIRMLSGGQFGAESLPVAGGKSTQFNQILSVAKNALASVNQAQFHGDNLKAAYLTGDNKVSISQVTMASMKSKVAFEGLLAVRNKLLESYREIMNMPI